MSLSSMLFIGTGCVNNQNTEIPRAVASGVVSSEDYETFEKWRNSSESLTPDNISHVLKYLNGVDFSTDQGQYKGVIAVPILAQIKSVPTNLRQEYKSVAINALKARTDTSLRMLGIGMIWRLNDADAITTIEPLLSDENDGVRNKASQIIGKLKGS